MSVACQRLVRVVLHFLYVVSFLFETGSAKFKVNVTGGHVHILCGDNSKMDVADKGGEIIGYFEEMVKCKCEI